MAGLKDLAALTVNKATAILTQHNQDMENKGVENFGKLSASDDSYLLTLSAHEAAVQAKLADNATARAQKTSAMNADLAYVEDTVDANTAKFEGLAEATAVLVAFDDQQNTNITALLSQEASDLQDWKDELGDSSDFDNGFAGVGSGNGANGNGAGNGAA